MKKLIIIPVILFCIGFANGQGSLNWNETFTINATFTDSVFQPSDNGDISGHMWTATFKTVDLDNSITIDIGGGNNPLDTLDNGAILYTFEGVPVDSLPYTFDPTNTYLQVITGIDTSIQKTFWSPQDKYGFDRPAFKMTNSTDDDWELQVYFNFFK
jgi:hypothetical protein